MVSFYVGGIGLIDVYIIEYLERVLLLFNYISAVMAVMAVMAENSALYCT